MGMQTGSYDFTAAKEAYNVANDALSNASEFIVGTQTGSTRFWTGTSVTLTELKDGTQITYWLPYASKSETAQSKSISASELVPSETVTTSYSNDWLKITFINGTSSAWIPCYYGGTTRLTTHYGAQSAIRLTYKTGVSTSIPAGWWADANYNVDTYENRINYFGGKTGSKGVWATSCFMEDANGTYQNICTASNGTVTTSNRTTATTKIRNTNGFKVGSSIWYTNTSYNANTNISGSGVCYSNTSLIDSRYTFNTMTGTTAAGTTGLTVYKPIYLVGSINDSDGLFYLDTTWWTQTATDPSKVYILFGAVVDITGSGTAYYYRVVLYEKNPWYIYDGTRLVDYNEESSRKLKNQSAGLSEVISEVRDAVQTINNGYVRWDSTNNRMIQVTNPDGSQEIINDFLTAWMQFGMDSSDIATLSLGDNTNSNITVSTKGVTIKNSQGITVGQYGEGARIGAPDSQHISIENGRINFWAGNENNGENLVAYVSGSEQLLHIPRVVVVQSLQMGNWRWDATIANHLSLNWIGG